MSCTKNADFIISFFSFYGKTQKQPLHIFGDTAGVALFFNLSFAI